MTKNRAGSVIKWILIVVGVLMLIGAGVFFYVRHRVTRGSEKPLEIPEVAGKPEVTTSLKRNVEQHTLGPAGATTANPSPSSVSLTGEELTLMVTKLLPPMPGMKLQVQIIDGKADIQMSLPTKELMKVVKDELGKVGDYIEANLVWVNVSAVASLSLSEGKLQIGVQQVRTPDFVSKKQLQDLLDSALKDRQPGPLVVPLEGMPFQVLELDLDGNVAVTKVARVPAGSDGKR